MRTALVTGSAGFIGYHVARRWLEEGWRVVGVDAFTEYYDPKLKRDRAALLAEFPEYHEVEGRIETPGLLAAVMSEHSPEHVVHLAAQAGVRHSIEAPRSYVEANLQGTFELLEAARANPGARLLMASTSSVYGANEDMPYAETDKADSQMSFYAATKKATEAMAHSYAHLYGLPTVMFRFFTVYGPWGRPDMALFKFVRAMLEGREIDVYNQGRMRRDFTFVDDLVEAVWRLANVFPEERLGDFDSLSPVAPFRIVNIGKAAPDTLDAFISTIETALGVSAVRNLMEMQAGDVPATWSDTTLLKAITGYAPSTGLDRGVPAFVTWYRNYYGV
ncbi:NAD-dependent epimerase/dehydratase family protein [Silicimonas algicola]|uniref:UDP-glucuronate 4-epimerase n=1 Tax=Silicimonas algicola TaxID=1826607 RepID=A0A316GDV2_9RHOB|nr:NAD-dependent epimerase/dehydratase family protein [Silicimonas algicola]AZQ66541.1 NAD-dependent epimerase/dehydratase family protein [Silicimonas algicola]PWK58882.1 UDP-glucuronate 4-epimerase [Silicimonas algicola]